MSSSERLKSEHTYQLLVEGILDVAIFMLDCSGTVVSWNLGAQRIKGYLPSEIIGRHFSQFYTAADTALGEPHRALCIARETGKFEGEGWRVRKDGTRFWASVVVEAIRNDTGELVGFAKITRDFTERSIKEEQRRVVVDAAPNGMLVIDEAGTITLANARAEQLFGYRSGALVGLAAERLLCGDVIDRITYRNLAPVLDRGPGRSELFAHDELIARRRDGKTFPAEVTLNATATARGPVIVASISDISERRAAENERRAAELSILKANRLMTMAEEMAQYGHWRIDLRTGEVFWSDEVYRTHGLPKSHKPTLAGGLAVYDPAGPDVGEIIRQAMIDGEPFTFESRILRPDGTFRDVRCAGRSEGDGEQPVSALVGIFQDITERKDAAREREALIERVTLATEAGKVGIWEWNVSAATLQWDAHMFALYGLDAARAPSYELWRDALHVEDRARCEREIADALAERQLFDTEFRVVWPNGEVHVIRAQATVVCNADGEPARMVGINWDITQARSLADQLSEQKQRAQAAERDRLYEHERKWSTTFQRAVLPLALPNLAGCTFDAVYEPGRGDAQVGGDWYDAVRLIDGRILVTIGDVSGNGLEAAVVVGVVRQIMRGISQLHANPTLILDAADRALCLEYPGVYVSAWVGLIDLVTRTITYASAGHPPPLVVSRHGAVRELEDATTLLIGLREGHRGQSSTIPIEQGDALVLYTDGVTEAGRDVIAGSRLLCEAASKFAIPPRRNPADAIKRYTIPEGSLDDVAVLVVRTDCREAERFIERWRFPARDAKAAAATRRDFVDSLEQYGLGSDECAHAELILSELIGNVVRHAGNSPDVEVVLDHGGAHSVLHVLDRGPGFHHISRLPPDPFAESGRGLFLIAALSIDFTVAERTDGGSHARVVLRGARRRHEQQPAA